MHEFMLDDVDGMMPPAEADYAKHVYHVYSVRTPERDAMIQALKAKEIYCGIHYPVPLHLQEAYRSLGYTKGDFPVAEQCCDTIMSLPMFPELTEEQIGEVVSQIREQFVQIG